jgi:hypothetical protein
MIPSVVALPSDYWQNFVITDEDFEFIYNTLLEKETPLTTVDLLIPILEERICQLKKEFVSKLSNSLDHYKPCEKYSVGQQLTFAKLSNQRGEVVSTRVGKNPEYTHFEVIEVRFSDSSTHYFASSYTNHKLNSPIQVQEKDPNLNAISILSNFGESLQAVLSESLHRKKDLVLIAGRWFPRSLLVDVNQGHLNLAEAILEEAQGGPLPISKIIDQADLPKNVNPQLLEFSLDLALQEDDRFDEVGPAGETLWFLKRFEPSGVQNQPSVLNYNPLNFDSTKIIKMLAFFNDNSTDEYQPGVDPGEPLNAVQIDLIYPHWEAGTLPLTNKLKRLFPYAHEAPRILFTFLDEENQDHFNGWVVQPKKYIFGLKEWYQKQGLIPGSIIHLARSKIAGEINLSVEKRRQNREWIRTPLIGSDGRLVFVMSKQPVTAAFNERLALYISDSNQFNQIWQKSNYQHMTLENVVKQIMLELAKLTPQGQIHAQELYAAVNLIRRCPPDPILDIINSSNWSEYLGDLYFRLKDSAM